MGYGLVPVGIEAANGTEENLPPHPQVAAFRNDPCDGVELLLDTGKIVISGDSGRNAESGIDGRADGSIRLTGG